MWGRCGGVECWGGGKCEGEGVEGKWGMGGGGEFGEGEECRGNRSSSERSECWGEE